MRRVYSVINIRDADLNKVLKYLEQYRYQNLYNSYLYRYVKGWDNAPCRDSLSYLCLNETDCKYNWTSTSSDIGIFMKDDIINNYKSFRDYVDKQRYKI